MAMEQVQGILEGLKIAQSRRAANMQNEQEKSRLAVADENEKARIQQQRDELKNREKEFDITTKAAQAMHKLTMMQTEQQIGKGMQEGVMPSGTQQQPQLPGVISPYQSFKVPGMDNPITILSPESHNELLKQRKIAEEAPEHTNRIEEINLNAKNQQILAEKNKAADLERMEVQKSWDLARAKDHETAENLRTNSTNATHIQAAKIAQGLEGLTPEMITPYVQQGLHGDLTETQLQKLPLPKGVKQAITNGITQGGGTLLTDEEQKLTQSFTPIVSIVNTIDQFNQVLKDHPTSARIPGTEAYKATSKFANELEGVMPNVARVIATDTGRLSNQQISLVRGMTEPSKNFLTSDAKTNEDKRNDFLLIAEKIIDSKLSRLPEAQRAAVKEKLGLSKLKIAGSPTQQQSSPSGGSHLYFDEKGNQVQGAK